MNKKIYKILSIVLTVALLISCCTVAFNTLATTNTPPTYYISSTGTVVTEQTDFTTGIGLSDDKPLKSVNGVIAAAKAAEYGAGDTVYIKVMDDKAPWDDNGVASITPHDFKLNISSYNTKVTVGNTKAITFNGDIDFTNIDVTVKSALFDINNNNIYFAKDSSMWSAGEFVTSAGSNPTEDFNIYFGCALTTNNYLNIGGRNVNRTFGTQDKSINVNVTVDNDDYSKFTFGDRGSRSNSATFDYCNLNFNLKSANKVDMGAWYNPYFTSNAAIQVINSTGADPLSSGSAKGYITGLKTTDGTTPVKYFIITNNTGDENAIEFTDTAGKYKVNLDTNKYDVELVDNAGETVATQGDDNCLTVTEKGEYTLKVTRKSNITVTYFISSTGTAVTEQTDFTTGIGLSDDKPLKSVNGVIAAAKAAEYGAGDTVCIEVMDNNAPWDDDGATSITQHDFKLNISSFNEKVTIGNNSAITFNGDIDFVNINIANKTGNGLFNLNNKNISFGEGTSYQSGSHFMTSNSSNPTEDFNLYFGCDMAGALCIGSNSNDRTFSGTQEKPINLNITVDNGAKGDFALLGKNNKISKYDYCNLNFNLKSATKVTFYGTSTASRFTTNAVVQVIDSTGNSVIEKSVSGDSAAKNYFSGVKTTDTSEPLKYFIITNNTGDKNAIEFTKTPGKYKVNLNPDDYAYVRLVNTVDESIYADLDADGYITIKEYGEYKLAFYKYPETITYYVSGSGSDDAEGTIDAPLKSVIGAINEAISDDVMKGDIVNIVVLDETTWKSSTQEAPTSHKFDLKVSTKDAQTIATIDLEGDGISLMGDTVIENILFKNYSQYGSSKFNDYNLTLGANTTFRVYTLGFGSANSGGTVEGQTVIFNNAINLDSVIRIANTNNGNKTYSEDVNIVLNNREAAPKFTLHMDYGMTSTYKKNINLNLKDAESVDFIYSAKSGYYPVAVAEGAVQFIIDKPYTIITDATKEYFEDVAPAKGTYYVYNTSGVDELLSFTDTAGKYAVDTETYIVKATKGGVDTFAENGFLTLTEGGEYTVTAELRPATTLEYFVEAGSDAENTFDTIAEAVVAAKAACLTKIDILNIKVTGTNVTMGELPEYSFTVIVESKSDKANINTQEYFIANGKTVYRNIDLCGKALDFNGKAVTLENTVGFNGLYIDASNAKATIDAKLDFVTIMGEDKFDLVVNNPESKFTVDFDTVEFSNIKINVKTADSVTFAGEPDVTGSVEIAVPNNAVVPDKAVFDSINAANKWYIVNKTDKADAIDFTNVAGSYDYISGYNIAMVGNDDTYKPVNIKLTVPAGEYDVVFLEQSESKYSDYINYRGTGLKNIYAKLKAGEQVNVLYMGGSVTHGDGSSNRALTSWRARTGKWIENIFSGANVKNVNIAYSGTGTWFGSYRLNENVIKQAPDLIFIEFAINDFYDHATEETAAMRFETIVRQIRTTYPECDIVTLFTTDTSNIASNIQGNIHSQARAHEKMAVEYDIPSLHVGRALADHLYSEAGDNWSSIWSDYMSDGVHPGDKGYDIYFKVVKEYLENELVYGTYDGTITNHIVPELQNDVLLDGDITYIDASKDLVAKSESLGGSGFTYITSVGSRGLYRGGVRSEDVGGKFVIKFTGTELTMLSDTSDSLKIRIDGGTETEYTFSGVHPYVLVDGLKNGEHTIEIISDSSFTINGFFTRDETKATRKLINGDVNIDGVFDIRDLVSTELIKENNIDFMYSFLMADRNSDSIVDYIDMKMLRVELLNSKK